MKITINIPDEAVSTIIAGLPSPLGFDTSGETQSGIITKYLKRVLSTAYKTKREEEITKQALISNPVNVEIT